MMDSKDMRRALTDLERHAPPEAVVLAGMREGIVRRRRHRQVASVVGAATAVALGVVFALPGRGGAPAASDPGSSPAQTPVTIANPAPPGPVLPITVGWLPSGYTLRTWDAGSTDGSAEYTGTKDFQDIVVWVSAQPREPIPGASKEPTTIGGRSGVLQRFDPGKAEAQLIWQFADGRWAMVGGRPPTGTVDMLHRVAESVTPPPPPMPVGPGL